MSEDVHNFTTCWQDGIVLCALMEALSPGACVSHRRLRRHHRVNNCRLGLQLAARYLQIPQVSQIPVDKSGESDTCR